jgi:hypothetical protein
MRDGGNNMFKKLTKTQVKALVKKEGTLDIALVPSNVYPDYNNPWVKPMDFILASDREGNVHQISETNYSMRTFDNLINEFSYYNCNNELGNRVHFYQIEK